MKHFLLINLSPRKAGTSVMLAQKCREHLVNKGHSVSLFHLYTHLNNFEEIIQAVQKADTLVFCGPCYINTYPADTYALLQELCDRKDVLHGQQIYSIIQGGMPYTHTHESGLHSLKLFADKCGLRYMGGFVMGLGAMLNGQPLEKLLNAKKAIPQLNLFLDHMEKGEVSPRLVYQAAQIRFPGFVWRLMARWMNKTIDKDLRTHGIDVKQPSPYLE